MLPIVYLQALLLNLRRLSYGLLTAIGLFGLSCHAADDNKDTLALLVHASAQRLALADDVALSKWQHAQAVEDKAREHIVIASAITKAAAYHLNAEQVSYFLPIKLKPTNGCSTP
ncbi:MAG: hypothetical protein IT497_08770 [Ottowia sp.]|nr:hypothetical protein [Ottowia sp.]